MVVAETGVGDASSLVHRRRWAILGVLVVSILVVTLDNTVLNVALPSIQEELGATQSQQEWIIDGYTLAFAALLFPYGVTGDLIGRRRVLFWGLLLFGLGSLASAYAATPDRLIAMRVVMGCGAAAVFPATLAIITNVFDGAERGRAIAIWAGFSGLAVGIGPLVGGALLDAGYWWGSVFLINVPIVAAGLVGIAVLVPESRDDHPRDLDVRGVLLAVAGLVLLVYGLIRAGESSDWTSPRVLLSMLAGVAVLAWFVLIERRNPDAALDMTWFRNPSFSSAVTALTLVAFALFGVMLFGTYYLQFDRGYSPLRAGSMLLPLAVGIGVFAPLSSVLTARFGPRAVCASGLALIGLSFGSFTVVDLATSVWVLETILFGLGVGFGLAMAPATTVVLESLPPQRAGAGSSVNSTVRQVGGALGVAVLGSVLSTVYRSQITSSLSVLPAPVRRPAGESIGATQVVVTKLAALLPDRGLALLHAASDAFIHAMHVTAAISGGVMVVAVAVVLVFMPPRRAGREATAAGPGRSASSRAARTPMP
ncbi:MAG TPA: DHA2 family efflux MFS transporter permease subunit [Actinomycetes bacterium]|nr:DHA2 family efflux MFS transporter permease subunit [Actinomycetes bacterium]